MSLRSALRTAGRIWVRAGSATSVALAVHTVVNARLLRTAPADPPALAEHASILLPVRNEAARVEPCLRSLLAVLDHADGRAELVVLDDCSTDGTADIVRRIVGDRPDVRLIHGRPVPAGWLGKPWACAQLSEAASETSTVLAFVDADVILEASAVRAALTLLRDARLQLVSPYPRQLAYTPSERVVQPLLQWSLLATLPLRLAERSRRPSLSAANGQFLCVDAAAYRATGGHGAVHAEVLEDLALVRAIKAAGGRGGVVDGTSLATCRMYSGRAEVRAGYLKSAWSAFGSPGGAAAVQVLLLSCFVVPPLAALRGSRWGLAGYAAAVTSRVVAARRTGGRPWPDALTHPLGIAAVAALTAESHVRRRSLTWKGRPV